ncbi:MAG: hypothetical protein QXY60_07740, partial [Saccharolobus sp.]
MNTRLVVNGRSLISLRRLQKLRWYTINIFLNIDYVRDIFNAMVEKNPNNTVSDNPKQSLSVIIKAMEMKTDFLNKLEINSEEDVRKLFEIIFYSKKHTKEVLEKNGIEKIKMAFQK